MIKIDKFLENYFFKVRRIFKVTKISRLNDFTDNLNFKLLVVKHKKDLPSNVRVELLSYILEEKLEKRLDNSFVTLYIAMDKESDRIAGYYWTVIPEKLPIWHDKTYVSKGSALGFNAFTVPCYRGKRVFPFLKAHATHQISNRGCSAFYSIVEKSNRPSIRSCYRLGLTVAGNNYLIKIFKRNIFSIININNKWEIHYVYRNAKSTSL